MAKQIINNREITTTCSHCGYFSCQCHIKSRTKDLETQILVLQAELAKHRWIPVAERLPEYLTLVIACIERDGGHRMVRIRQMGKPNEWFDEYDRSTMNMKQKEENVVWWMSLPEDKDNG